MVQDKAAIYYIDQIFLTNFIFNNVFLYKRDLQKNSRTLWKHPFYPKLSEIFFSKLVSGNQP